MGVGWGGVGMGVCRVHGTLVVPTLVGINCQTKSCSVGEGSNSLNDEQ